VIRKKFELKGGWGFYVTNCYAAEQMRAGYPLSKPKPTTQAPVCTPRLTFGSVGTIIGYVDSESHDEFA
jgi:hypothetical protein